MDSMDFVTLYRTDTAALSSRLERRRLAEEARARRGRSGRRRLRDTIAHRTTAGGLQQH